MELPTIQTSGVSSGSEFMGSPIYRRTHRKQGSTVFVAPRDEVPEQVKVPLNSVARGVGALAGAQALGKLVSFVLNQMLLRVVNSTDLGQTSQMELFAATILSLTRDAVRFAAVRETLFTKADDRYHTGSEPVHGTKSGTMQETVNIGFLPLGLALPLVAILMAFTWRNTIDPILRATSAMWALSILVELISEPCFLLYQLKMNMARRARVESIAAILRGIVTLTLIMAGHSTVLAFGIGQLAYSLGICCGYYVAGISEYHYAGFKLYLQRVWDDATNRKIWFDSRIFTLARGMYLQSIFKYMLTESDRILVSFLLPLAKQGEYALAANYGSLLARLLLFPVEEALRSLFAKTLKGSGEKEQHQKEEESTISQPAGLSPGFSPGLSPGQPSVGRQRSLSVRPGRADSVRSRSNSGVAAPVLMSPVAARKPETDKISDTETAQTALTTVLRLYLYIGIGAVGVGPYIAPFGLLLMLSHTWAATQAPQVLAAYVCYIPILAWNGSLEAFVQSVASIDDLKRQSKLMLLLAGVFIVAAYTFMNVLSLGAVGLVYAQMLNMVLRTAWSFRYVSSYFNKYNVQKWWQGIIPPMSICVFSAVLVALAHVIGTIDTPVKLALHISIGGALVSLFLYAERSHLLELWKKFKS